MLESRETHLLFAPTVAQVPWKTGGEAGGAENCLLMKGICFTESTKTAVVARGRTGQEWLGAVPIIDLSTGFLAHLELGHAPMEGLSMCEFCGMDSSRGPLT